MKTRILHLLACIFIIVAFVQCDDPITATADTEELTKLSLISPEDNTEQPTSLSFKWDNIELADSYQIQLSAKEDFSSLVVDSVADSTEFEIKGLSSDTTIYWKVRPIARQQEGRWSETWQFTTEEQTENSESEPISTDLKSPEDGATGVLTDQKLTWTVIANSSAYKVQLATDQDFNSMVIDQEVESSSYQASDLSYQKTYYWRVKSIVPERETKWSETWQFITEEQTENSEPLSAPVQISPKDDATNVSLQPTFEWNSVEGADHYILHANRIDPAEMVVETEVNDTTFTPENELDSQTTHDWRVRAVKDGNKGSWSEIHRFTTTSQSGNSTPPAEGSRSGDEAALEALYESTNGSNWDNNTGWSSSGMSLEDNIYGVEVATIDGELRVVSVKLNGTTGWIRKYKEGKEGKDGNNLTGTLPPEIGNLTACRYFNVKQNNLTDTIPEEIGNMTSLQALYLNGRFSDFGSTNKPQHPGKDHDTNERTNSFSGQFPSSIGNLSNLLYLEAAGEPHWSEKNLGNQGFTGAVPSSLNKLTNLKRLHLSFSSFTSIPDLSNLNNLYDFAVAHNNISQSFPDWMSGLTDLRYVWMQVAGGGEDGTGFSGDLADLSALTRLELFDVSANSLSGNFPNYMINGTMPEINMLLLSWNDNISGTLGEFGETNLTMLSVSGCSMTGELPPSLSNQKKMINLNLGWNNFSGPFPDLSKMYQLRHVRANENSFTGKIPMVDTSNDALQFLHFQNNQFTDEVPSKLADMGDLPLVGEDDLNLVGNSFSDSDLQDLIDALSADGNLHILNY